MSWSMLKLQHRFSDEHNFLPLAATNSLRK
jgi:hypothetical protein